MAATPDGWDLDVFVDRHLGVMAFRPTCPHGQQRQAPYIVPLVTMLRRIGIKPDELRALLADADDPTTHSDVQTSDTLKRLCADAMPADLTGKTVLDIGGYDGEAARLALDRGAARAICLDSLQWTHYGWTEAPALPGVEYVVGDLMDWAEPVDVVLFFNVAYHLKAPYLAFEHLRRITTERIALCSLVDWSDRPVWTIRRPFEVNPKDDTVFWTPSEPGLVTLLEVAGFTDVARVGKAIDRVVLTAQ